MKGAVLVERIGSAVVVRSGGARDLGGQLATLLPEEAGRTPVFVDRSAFDSFDRLDSRLVTELKAQLRRSGRKSVRLLAAESGKRRADGAPPVAARLAGLLGVDVVAPDGKLLVLRGGELFSAGTDGGWVSFRAGRPVAREGARFPSPSWQQALPPDGGWAGNPQIAVTAIPAGLWVRAAGHQQPAISDEGFAVPMVGQRPALVVGAPGEPLPELGAVARLVESLPASLRETFGLIVYGPEPAHLKPLAQRLAERLGAPVHSCHAMPFYTSDGARTGAVVDAARRRTWRPFVFESIHRPGRPPVPHGWKSPAPGLMRADAGSYWLQDDWLVDVLPSGLLIRKAGAAPDPDLGLLPPAPGHVNLIVAAPAPPQVLSAVQRLTNSVPADVRPRLRLIAAPGFDPSCLTGLGRALGAEVHSLDPADARHAADWDSAPARQVQPTGAADRPVLPKSTVPRGIGTVSSAPPPAAAAGEGVADITRTGGYGAPAEHGPRTGTVVASAESNGTAAVSEPVRAWSGALPPMESQVDVPVAEVTGAPRAMRPVEAVEWLPVEWPADDPAQPAKEVPNPPAEPDDTDSESATRTKGTGSEPATQSEDSGSEPAAASERTGSEPTAEPDRTGSEPATEIAPAAAAPLLLDAQPSAAADRERFRRSLGWRYDAAARAVTRLLAERPGLRGGAPADEAMMTELAATHVFASSSQVDVVESVRYGGEPVDHPYLSCLTAGLRRLPSFQGVVVRGGSGDSGTVENYAAGAEFVEPAPLVAVADPEAAVPGDIEFLIWSVTARRLSGLVQGPRADEVVFPPATMFRVLAVEVARSQVLLAEVRSGRRGDQEQRHTRILSRLTDAAQARPAVPGAEFGDADQARFAALPGEPSSAFATSERRKAS